MKRLFKLFLALAVGSLVVGCYNDYDNPAPAKIYTDADFSALTYWSIKDVKAKFRAANPGMNEGTAASWTVTEPAYTRGKVMSSDYTGNVYKTVYIYDEESNSAMEIKLNTGNYLIHPPGQIVYVKLQDLVIGNYRGMISIGTTSTDPKYANNNITEKVMTKRHIFNGEVQPMVAADTLVVTDEVGENHYSTKLSDAALGRLVRFEDVKSTFGPSGFGYKNTFPNYFANSTSYDVNTDNTVSPYIPEELQWHNIDKWATWGAKRTMPVPDTGKPDYFEDTFFFGSAWFTYGNTSSVEGNYIVRTSGYATFRDAKIPANNTIVTLTALYTKYTGTAGQNPTYQLVLNSLNDVVVLP